jgi:hypothetical protein
MQDLFDRPDSESRKFAGMISLDDLLKARVRNLDEERRRERVLRIRVPFQRPARTVSTVIGIETKDLFRAQRYGALGSTCCV